MKARISSIRRCIGSSQFERLEDRCMLALTAPDILFADDAGHLDPADQLSEAAYRNIMVQSSGKVVVAGTAKGPDGNDDFYLAQ